MQEYVVEFNRRNVESKSRQQQQQQQQQQSSPRRVVEKPNRIMFTGSNSGTEIPRAKLQQIVKNTVQLAGINKSKTGNSQRDFILIKSVIQSHLTYNNWCFPRIWCMLCGGDHKRYTCPDCKD